MFGKQDWTVRGRIVVDQSLEVGKKLETPTPLKDVIVKISAREKILGKWMTWAPWKKTVTKSDGSFKIQKTKDKSDRQFKVQVRFKDDELVIYGDNDSTLSQVLAGLNPVTLFDPRSTLALEGILDHTSRATFKSDWYEIFRDSSNVARKSGDHNLGTLTIRDNTDPSMGPGRARDHASIWAVSKEVIDYFKSLGYEYRFKKKVAIKYPHNNHLIGDNIEASYSSPENYCTYIIRNSEKDQLNTPILIHEIMHLWTYRNVTKEKGLAWQLIIHGSTHDGRQNKTYVAFHEAWAEFASNYIQLEVFGYTDKINDSQHFVVQPLSRPELMRRSIIDIREVDHYEYGWMHVFHILACNFLLNCDLNVDAGFYCEGARIPDPNEPIDFTFKEMLSIFLEDSKFGNGKQMKRKEMNLDDYLFRATNSVSWFNNDLSSKVKKLIDPDARSNPIDVFSNISTPSKTNTRPGAKGEEKTTSTDPTDKDKGRTPRPDRKDKRKRTSQHTTGKTQPKKSRKLK